MRNYKNNWLVFFHLSLYVVAELVSLKGSWSKVRNAAFELGLAAGLTH